MSTVYDRIVMGKSLMCLTPQQVANRPNPLEGCYIVTNLRGGLFAPNNAAVTVPIPPPVGNNQYLGSDIDTVSNPTGLLWKTMPSAIDPAALAGVGLTYNPNGTLNVAVPASNTIGAVAAVGATPSNIFVKTTNSAVNGAPLLATTPGAEAVYGALDLAVPGHVSGALPVANGGTGFTGPLNANTLVGTNAAGNFATTNISLAAIAGLLPTTANTSSTDAAPFTVTLGAIAAGTRVFSVIVEAVAIIADSANPGDNARSVTFTINASFYRVTSGSTITYSQLGTFDNLQYTPTDNPLNIDVTVTPASGSTNPGAFNVAAVLTGVNGQVDWIVRSRNLLALA